MNLNYVDDDSCPVVLTLTMRELDRLLEATAEVDAGPVSRMHEELTEIRKEAIHRGQEMFAYRAGIHKT